jgi:nucleoside-triphosphatase THEP1
VALPAPRWPCRDGVIAEVKQRPDAEIWTVTRENRDDLPERVLVWLRMA